MRETPFTPAGDVVRWVDVPAPAGSTEDSTAARVYLPGLGGTSQNTWGHIAPHPELAGHRSILIDLPGHGHSDRPIDYGYTLEDHAAAVAAVLGDAGVNAVDLIGHSMGGSIAILLGTRRPDLVGRLVVAEANLDRAPPALDGLGSQWIACRSEEQFVAAGCDELARNDPAWGVTLRLCAPFAVYRSAVSLIAGTEPSLREMLRALRIPRTFVASSDGEGVERAEGLDAAGVRVVVIPDSGHSMMVDQPEIFVRELTAALAADHASVAP